MATIDSTATTKEPSDEQETPPIRIGISACLLGEKVRYNGGHKQSRLCLEQLADYFAFEPLCPEVGIGLGIPREPIRLVGDPAAPRAVGTDNPDRDVTEPLRQFAHEHQPQLEGMSGFILMKNSPSCGMERVKVYRDNGYPQQEPGSGIFAAELMQLNPLLPVEEEGRLHDAVLYENFIMRVFTYYQWQQLRAGGISAKALVEFHSQQKYLLMAHHHPSYRYLGQLLADLKNRDLEQLADHYIETLMHGLKHKATRKTHTNVMQHLLGYLKKSLDSDTRQDLLEQIELYRQGQIPLVAAMTLLNHYLLRHCDGYLKQQRYLQPHPRALGLRNRI